MDRQAFAKITSASSTIGIDFAKNTKSGSFTYNIDPRAIQITQY